MMNKQALIKLATLRLAINHVLRQRMVKNAFWPFSKKKYDFTKADILRDAAAAKALLNSYNQQDWDSAYSSFYSSNPDIVKQEYFPKIKGKHAAESQKEMLKEYLMYKHNIKHPYWDDPDSFLDGVPGLEYSDISSSAANKRVHEPLSDKEKELMLQYMNASREYSPFEKELYLRQGINGLKRLAESTDWGKSYYPGGKPFYLEDLAYDAGLPDEEVPDIEQAYWDRVQRVIGRKF